MTPLEHYQKDLQRDDFSPDAAQQLAVNLLQRLFDELIAQPEPAKTWFKWKKAEVKPAPKGLYFWGGVGRGKTYLMDIFFDALPFEQKLRLHFHRFMRRVHQELKTLDGQKNPLDIVAQRIADEARVICFDEFFVSDITDAMLLGGLFEKLFGLGVTLVATSNIVPEKLYENGLQRQRFLPAIEQLLQHCEVVNVDGGVDYRLRTLEQAELYHSPLDQAADVSLLKSFESLAPDLTSVKVNTLISVEGRDIACLRAVDDVIWFDFNVICNIPRSQNDYIELAMVYHAVIISNVPQFTLENNDMARRFINLVDEFYDHSVKLILSAAAPIHELYLGGTLAFEFERTQSRLLEMQSQEYLARAHQAH